MSDRETDELVAIVERGLACAMKKTGDELAARLALTVAQQDQHRAAGRGIEAAACAIRAQALREAIAVLKGNAIPGLRSFVRAGLHSAETRS